MLADPNLVTALTEILAFSRSGPTVDELMALFTSHALALVPADRVGVSPLPAPSASPQGEATASTACHGGVFPVSCGRAAWGELQLSRRDGPLSDEDLRRGRLFAEVLGAALAASTVDAALPEAHEEYARTVPSPAGPPDSDDLVALVMDCAEALDRMPDAPTRARLALVAGHLAKAIDSPSWWVGLAHRGMLYDLSDCPASSTGASDDGGTVPAASVRLSRFPARRRASEGWAFYADARSGDVAERRVLAARGHSAVIGAGGYDPDGRSWVVEVFASSGATVERVTPVLAALVQEALSFPRGAFVPHAEDPRVLAILGRPGRGGRDSEAGGLGEAG